MQQGEKLTETSFLSLSTLTPDCIKSFLEKIEAPPEDNSEIRQINTNHLLKNIRSQIINTPSSLDKTTILNIISTLKEIFQVSSSDQIFNKLSEIIFLLETRTPKSLKDLKDSIKDLVLEFSNYKNYFSSLIIYLESNYSKISNSEITSSDKLLDDFSIKLYSFSTEILKINSKLKYNEVKIFLSSHKDSFKYAFFVCLNRCRRYLQIKKIRKVFDIVLDLLSNFIQDQEFCSFSSIFIISFLSEIQEDWNLYQPVSITIVNFLQKNLTKANYNELLCIETIFSQPMIVTLPKEPYKESWFKLWDLAYNILPRGHLNQVLIQQFMKISNNMYQQGISIFLKRCEDKYRDIVELINGSAYVEKLLNEIMKNHESERIIEFLSDSIQVLAAVSVNKKVFQLILHENMLKNEICQKKFKKVIKIFLMNCSKSEFDLSEFIRECKSFWVVKFLVSCLAEGMFKEITDRLVDGKLVEVLAEVLQKDWDDIGQDDLADLFKYSFKIFIISIDCNKTLRASTISSIIKRIQSFPLSSQKSKIIEKSVPILQKFQKQKFSNKIFLLSLELTSYPSDSPSVLHFQEDLLKCFKLSKIGFNKVDLIVSIIILHFKTHHLDNFYLKILEKCLKFSASPQNVVDLMQVTLASNEEKSLKVLEIVKNSILYPSCTKFWYFRGKGPEVFKFCEPVKLSNELSICLKVKLSKGQVDSELFILRDENHFRLSSKISNRKLVISIKSQKINEDFQFDSELESKSFNFISFSILSGRNSTIFIFINNNSYIKSFNDLKFPSKLSEIAIGGNIESSVKDSTDQSQSFIGKISGMMIIKKSLSENQMKSLQKSSLFKLPEELKSLKDKIVFVLSPKQKFTVTKRENKEKNSYFFKGRSLEKSFKYCTSILHELTRKISSEEIFIILLEILEIISNSKEFSIKCLLRSLSCRLIPSFKAYSKYLRLLISLKDLKLKKELYFNLLANDLDHSIVEFETFEIFLQDYRDVVKFNSNNFLLVLRILNNMKEEDVVKVVEIFSEQLSDCETDAEILATLGQQVIMQQRSGHHRNISNICAVLEIISRIDLKENSDNFFKVLMHLLGNINLDSSSVFIYIIIFNFHLKPESTRTSFGKDSTRNKLNDLNKYLLYINEKMVNEVHLVLDSFFYITSKNIRFTDKSNIRNLFEIVLNHSYSLSIETYEKFHNFLQYFTSNFNSAIIKSPHYPISFINLIKRFELRAGESLVFIYSNLKKIKSFEKLVELFRNIKDKDFSFNIFENLFHVLTSTKFIEQTHLLAELMMILSFFHINHENSEAYCNIVIKFAKIIESNPKVLKFSHDYSTYMNEKLIGNIFFTIAFQVFYTKPEILFENCKKIVMLPEVDFFTKLKLDKIDEDHSILFTFIKTSYLIMQNYEPFNEFLEKYKGKTRVLERIEELFLAMTSEQLASMQVHSIAGVDVPAGFEFNKEKSLDQLRLGKNGFIGTLIKTDEWILNVYLLLHQLIIHPFEVLLSTAKEVISKSRQSKKSRAGSLDPSTFFQTQGKLDYFLIEVACLKQRSKNWMKNNVYSQNDKDLESACYARKNYQDCFARPSRVKLVKKKKTEYDTKRALYKRSLIRSKSMIDCSSLYLAEKSNFTILPEYPDANPKSDQFQDDFEQITAEGSYYGKISIIKTYIELKFEDKPKPESKRKLGALEYTIRKKQSTKLIQSSEIFEIITRKFIHRNTAFEIFLHTGRSYFINFFMENKRSEALSQVKRWRGLMVVEDPTDILSALKKKWTEGQINNFQYLMMINKYSGRSFNDLSQYPVFPWVLTDFHSSSLDLKSPAVYRNFNYPVTAQTEKQRKDLEFRARVNTGSVMEDHQNGTHYSNGGVVLYYLFRLEHFTEQATILHDNGFDHPDRMFFNMKISWQSCISLGDSKELVPELFYSPEVLANLNELCVGLNSLENDSSLFVVPPWASNLWDFVRKHRKALESVVVSKELHKWIDLVFGFKQRGRLAKENFNLFMKVTYDDLFDGGGSKSILDNIEGIIDQVYHFGQTPRQVFFQAHSKRKVLGFGDFFERVVENAAEVSEFRIGLNPKMDVKAVVAGGDLVIVFFMVDAEIYFSKFKVKKKISEKGKNFLLFGAKWTNEMKFLIWSSWIVSYGYSDFKIRIHYFSGEIKTQIKTSNIQPSSVLCRSNMYYADFNIIVSINQSLKLTQKFYGHTERITFLSISESYSLLSSLSEKGRILLHDLKNSEILISFSFPLHSLSISEYGLLIGLTESSFSLLTFQGKKICTSPLAMQHFAILNKTGEYLIYSQKDFLIILSLFDNKKEFSRPIKNSLICLNDSNKFIALVSLETNELIIIS